MRNYKYHRVTGVAAATTALAIAAGAVPSSDVRAADAQAGALEEIIVTASKRQESVLDLPISVSAIDAQQLERKGVKDLEELSRSVPGLAVTPAGENEPKRFILRGIGPAFGTAATVAVYVDDTPITIGTNSPDLKLFDVERIEVLRGPQGTLFGSSAMGGAIRYVAPQPSFDEFGGSAKARDLDNRRRRSELRGAGCARRPALGKSRLPRLGFLSQGRRLHRRGRRRQR